eukprot:445558-Pleurochrysis_carterae.AAC.2
MPGTTRASSTLSAGASARPLIFVPCQTYLTQLSTKLLTQPIHLPNLSIYTTMATHPPTRLPIHLFSYVTTRLPSPPRPGMTRVSGTPSAGTSARPRTLGCSSPPTRCTGARQAQGLCTINDFRSRHHRARSVQD